MVRVVSLIKRLIKDDSDDDEQPVKLSPDGEDDYPASVVFQKLSDLTSKKVIIGVLLILLIVPLLAVETIDVVRIFHIFCVIWLLVTLVAVISVGVGHDSYEVCADNLIKWEQLF